MSGLKKTLIKPFEIEWSDLDLNTQKIYKKMEDLLAPDQEYLNYKQHLEELEQKNVPYIPNISIHLKEIEFFQSAFDKKESSPTILDVINNGKKIWCILRAQKNRYDFKRDHEMCSYLTDSRYLGYELVYDLVDRRYLVATTPLPQKEEKKNEKKDDLKKSKRISLPIKVDKLSDKTFSKKNIRKDALENFKKHNQRIPLHKLKENDFHKINKSTNLEHLALWKLWNELKFLFTCEDKDFINVLKDLRKRHFSQESKVNFFISP